MTTLKQLVLATTLAIAVAGVASGAPATGAVSFLFGGLSSNTPGALVAGSVFTTLAPEVEGDGVGDFACGGADPICDGDPLTVTGSGFTGDGLIGVQFSFGPALRYTFTVTAQVAPQILGGPPLTGYIVQTLGDFEDSLGVFDDGDASLIIGITEACSPGGCTYQGGASFQIPPAQIIIPEPATMALLGSALIGIAALRVRRNRDRR